MSTVLFFPEGAFGPTNNCVGIAAELQRRGHRAVFVAEESFAGTLQARGFEERLVQLAPPPDTPQAPGQFWKDFVRDTAPVLRGTTAEQLAGFVEPTFRALCDGAVHVDEQLTGVLDEVGPDVVVVDNVVSFPAVVAGDRPWVRVVSCNPLEVPDADLPPAYSGLPTQPGGNCREQWADFRAEARRVLSPLHREFSDACQARGTAALPALEFVHSSPWLNLTLYPSELDYRRSVPLDATWQDLQTCVRSTDAPWSVPAELAGDGPLVYLSLGSLGSADLPLMQGLVDALSGTRYRVVVSMGPLHDQLRLGAGMAGEEFLPQTSVLPHVDVVVTHGGNNTVTECMWFGKPMVVLPLFWDQHDNAQRVDETGHGRRLPTYTTGRQELTAAIEEVLADRAMAGRLATASQRLREVPGTLRAADLLEQLAVSR